MRVIYSLRSKDLNAVAAEAAWAEVHGVRRRLQQRDRPRPFPAPDPGGHVNFAGSPWETHVAIAFPRSPMVTAHTSRDLHDLSRGRLRLGLGTQVQGTHRAALFHQVGVAGSTAEGIRAVVAGDLGLLERRRQD